jgi:hypothetical protein
LEKNEEIDQNRKMGAEEYEIDLVYTLEVSSSPAWERRFVGSMESVAEAMW